MPSIRAAAVCLNQMPLDWQGNKERILQAFSSAKQAKVSLICLPELCISGYGCQDLFLWPFVAKKACELLSELIPATEGLLVALGVPLAFEGKLYNGVAVICNGVLLGINLKHVLANDGVYYEPRWFQPWPEGKVAEISIAGEKIPIGDIVYQCPFFRLGLEICEEAWVAGRRAEQLQREGVEIILNPSASHFARGKMEQRTRLAKEGSARGGAYIYANHLGNDSGRLLFDGGGLIAKAGQLVAASPRCTYDDFTFASATIEISKSDFAQPVAGLVRHFDLPQSFFENSKSSPSLDLSDDPFELFTKAATLALFDYFRRSRAKAFVVSLSGGRDSAACTTLVVLMILRGLRHFEKLFQEKLGYLGDFQKLNQESLIATLLHCVYQKTAESSVTSEEAAAAFCSEIGGRYYSLDLQGIVSNYETLVESMLGRKLSWEQDDILRQNLRARTRSPGAWALANALSALLLTTSNRSEAAVGYCTMDGDTSGGLSPLAGVDKPFLNSWLEWLASTGPHDLQPLSALRQVFVLPPTAELRPLSEDQRDELDLMPYQHLDSLERAFLVERQSPLELAALKNTCWSAAEAHKFFALWRSSQWKRERLAVSFHFDTHSVDPKTWCRFPVLCGDLLS